MNRKKMTVLALIAAIFSLGFCPLVGNVAPLLVNASAEISAKEKTMIYSVIDTAEEALAKEISEAYKEYGLARNTITNVREPDNEHYIRATAVLQELIEREPNNITALALLSQVYRARGSATYAREYFKRCIANVQEIADREDISGRAIFSDLTLAVLYAAGDVRFWPEKDSYLLDAKILANIVRRKIALIKDNSLFDSRKTVAWEKLNQAEAVACIISGDIDEARKILAFGNKNSDKLFELAANGKWKWPVTENSAIPEFLLDYLYNLKQGVEIRSNMVTNQIGNGVEK